MTWTRRRFLTVSSLAAAGGAAVLRVPLLAQDAPPATAFTPLRRDVGFFTGRGGTIGWLISGDALAVVDSQFPDTAKACLAGVQERAPGRSIDYLINTHHHFDHTAGNLVFREAARKIVAHARVPELQKAAAARQGSEAAQAYPDTTFPETWRADAGTEVVSAQHYGPAHTGGDIVVHFERADVVHMGDLMFNRLHPFIDRRAGASVAGWIGLLERVAAAHSDGTIFIFGHAGDGWAVTGGKAELMVQRDYLTALLDHVRHRIKAGRSRDEIVTSTEPLAGFPDHGPLLERALAPAYDEVAG